MKVFTWDEAKNERLKAERGVGFEQDYAYVVPFVEDDTTVFLKTIIPRRKATKQYLSDDDET